MTVEVGRSHDSLIAARRPNRGFDLDCAAFGIAVMYDDVIVGDYAVDLLVENPARVELKVVKALDAIPAAQCLNDLKATGLPICLLLNFGRPRLEIGSLICG